jgi:uncharacterized phage protein gp47/JayE
MPWTSPTLESLRSINRDNVTVKLRSGPMIPNSVLRVMADVSAGIVYQLVLYLGWLAGNFLPDKADLTWLLRWAAIKNIPVGQATYASAVATASGIEGIPILAGSLLTAQSGTATGGIQTILFQTTQQITMGSVGTPVPLVALTAGVTGLMVGSLLQFSPGIAGINGQAPIASITDGIAADTEDEVRANVLAALRQPPMGGDAQDYVEWATQYPGCTRAWCSPLEMGIGTVTVRFMMDITRATSNPLTSGFPTPVDVQGMQTWLDSKRPVTALDLFAVAPVPQAVNVTINNLVTSFSQGEPVISSTIDASTMANIVAGLKNLMFTQGSPAYALNGVTQPPQTIYSVWMSDAILNASGVVSFDFSTPDAVMPNNGCIAVLGNIILISD